MRCCCRKVGRSGSSLTSATGGPEILSTRRPRTLVCITVRLAGRTVDRGRETASRTTSHCSYLPLIEPQARPTLPLRTSRCWDGSAGALLSLTGHAICIWPQDLCKNRGSEAGTGYRFGLQAAIAWLPVRPLQSEGITIVDRRPHTGGSDG